MNRSHFSVSPRIERLVPRAAEFYDNGDPSHDFAHVERVVANCERLGRAEGADLEVLIAAALLHDIVNLPKNHPERTRASQLAAERSRSLLDEVGFDAGEIERICAVIVEHSFSLGKKPSSRESAVLQDADKLDALGAIGVMRTVTCGARMGCSYYNVDEPFASKRALNDKAHTLDHFFVKLFRLPELMNTESGRAEANRRREFMMQFLKQLEGEISIAE